MIQGDASGFVCGEERFDAELVQANVQWRAEGREGGEETKGRALPPVIDRQER